MTTSYPLQSTSIVPTNSMLVPQSMYRPWSILVHLLVEHETILISRDAHVQMYTLPQHHETISLVEQLPINHTLRDTIPNIVIWFHFGGMVKQGSFSGTPSSEVLYNLNPPPHSSLHPSSSSPFTKYKIKLTLLVPITSSCVNKCPPFSYELMLISVLVPERALTPVTAHRKSRNSCEYNAFRSLRREGSDSSSEEGRPERLARSPVCETE